VSVRPAITAAFGALVLASVACRQIGFDNHPMEIDRDVVTMSNGVRYQELFLGSGPAAVHGDELLVDYVVALPDETRVDSTVDRGLPVTMEVGHALVPGLDDALVCMRPDGRRRIWVPAALAYGEKGVEDMIPPNSDLVFEVHVLEVHPKTH
jgi:FKBP-type peptidyl-prolyl cis-trans isomerase